MESAIEEKKTLEYSAPSPARLMTRATSFITVAQGYVIDSPQMFEAAKEDLDRVTKWLKEIEDQRLAITRPMDQAKAAVMELFREPKLRAEQAQKMIRDMMTQYSLAEEKKRREAEEKLAEEARQHREALEAEARKKAEEAQKAAAAGNEAAAQAAAIVAESMQAAAAVVVAPTVRPALQKTGFSIRKTWKARIVDKAAFIRAIAERPDLLDLVEVNESHLNALARMSGANFKIPGAEAYEEATGSNRVR